MTQAALLSAALWGIPRGKELRQPLADGQQGMEVLGPLACKELKPANGHVSLDVDPSRPSFQMRPSCG